MVRLAKVINELTERVTLLKSTSDLAQILLLTREPGLSIFNSNNEYKFLESLLIQPKDINLARVFLQRRIFTLSQVGPVCLREISIFNNILYSAFSFNFQEFKLEKGSFNIHIKLKGPGASNLCEKLDVIQLKDCKWFIDFLPVGCYLPNLSTKYWIELDFALVNLETEMVLYQDTYTFQPFLVRSSKPYHNIVFFQLFESHSQSYARLKKSEKSVLLELNLLDHASQPVYLSWTKINQNNSEEVTLIPKYFYDVFLIDLYENVRSLTCSSSNYALFRLGQ